MSNVLSDDKRQQIIALGRLGWSLRRIEQAIGVRRETASGYLRDAGISVRQPGNRGRAAKPAIEVFTDSDPANRVILEDNKAEVAKPAIKVFTDSGLTKPATDPSARPDKALTLSSCEPYRELIEMGLQRGRNAMAIWQDLVSDYGFAHSYQSVRRFINKQQPSVVQPARAVIVTEPGEEAQVDYGTGPWVRDPQSGKYRRTRLFVMTLGYSRKCVRLLVFRSSARVWAELHETAFRRLGGSVRVVVLDNLREGVLKPDIYDPTLNPLYRDLLAHYGAVALPCRVNDPDRKGKVEAGVGHAKKTPLKGQRFESLEAAQAYLDRWETNWADTRIHGTTKRQVATMFAEERPHLLPLPLEPFRFYEYGQRVVNLDGCVEVEAAYYSAPPGWLGRRVPVQWDGLYVRLLHPQTGQLLREHLRQKRGCYRIQEQDRSPRTPPSTVQLLNRATRAGTSIGKLCEAIHQRQGQIGVRRILGVLSLAKRFGPVLVEEACAAALELGVHEYHFVRRYLERQPALPLTLQQVDPLIRELQQYRDVIQLRLKESEPT
ncbi:MAG TPA: IS21 family transposase [Pyrinomonadaceae bacterium]